MMTEEMEAKIGTDEKPLVDSKQCAASTFRFGEERGSWILRNSGEYLPKSMGS
jgi:hypothetical protein